MLIYFTIADAYYCTKNGMVKGVLTLGEHLILFNPIQCTENDKIVCTLSDSFSNLLIFFRAKTYQATRRVSIFLILSPAKK